MKPDVTKTPAKGAAPSPQGTQGPQGSSRGRRTRVLCKDRRRLGANLTLTGRIEVQKVMRPRKWKERRSHHDHERASTLKRGRRATKVSLRQRKRRTKDALKRVYHQLAKVKTLYHTVSVSARRHALRSKSETGIPIGNLELRRDVLLFRAGLALSLAQAHTRCVSGHVLRWRPDAPQPEVWTDPSSKLPAGSCLRRRPETWAKRRPQAEKRGKSQTPSLPYRQINADRGVRYRKHCPRDYEILYPKRSRRTVMPRIQGKR
jgi:hypothetical protein